MGFGFGQGRRAVMRELAAEADLADMFAPQGGEGEALERPAVKKHLLRLGLTLAISALFVTLLSQRLAGLDFSATFGAVTSVGALAWGAALALTGLAFWAVGHYDAVLHRHFETGVDARRARAAGISAIAVSQTLGLGVVTGAILRWRMLPEHSFWLASRITVAVAASFLGAWAVVTALAMIAHDLHGYAGFAWVVLAGAGAAVCLAILAPSAPFRWPNLFTISALLGLCAVDTLAAGGALYILLPADIGLSFAVFFPVFLISYGAGLLSGAPAGLGAFELTLLALLPHLPEAHLIAAILCWRLAYFALPAVLGAAIAMRGPRAPAPLASTQMRAGLPLAPLPPQTPAEYGLLAQGEHRVLQAGGCAWMTSPRGHVLVGLLDPALCDASAASRDTMLLALAQAAQSSARWPAVYKASPRTAAHAAAHGWRALRLAREAVLRPDLYDIASPARANLRRKLRRAEAAGVMVQHIPASDLPMPALAAVSQAWVQAHGGERGFSMGRFAQGYLRGQRVYVARKDGAIIAYASFHETSYEWALDLMRAGRDLPDGTMQALVHAALLDAAALGIPRLSLAAAPESAFATGRTARRLQRLAPIARLLRLDTGHGLRQFKDMFAPDWQPRYICAPHAAALALAVLSIARAVAFPRALPQDQESAAETLHPRDNRFALPAAIWHAKGKISAN